MPPPYIYTTAQYPYASAMWDEAYDHLQTSPGWSTVLIKCPDPRETETTAKSEMAARGLAAHALVYPDSFGRAHIIRISRLVHLDPRWDQLADHFALAANTSALIAVEDPNAALAAVHPALAERGLNVSAGLVLDNESGMGLLRVDRK